MNTTIKTRTVKGEPMHIHIRLSDPCGNGHNDFAITADIWPKSAKRLTDSNIAMCGQCHSEIIKKMPSLKPFVDLHLCDETGAPMYAVENGYYHLFGSPIHTFAEYMRIDLETAKEVKIATLNKKQFSEWVDTQRPRWQAEADEAKKLLLELAAQ